MYGRWWRFEFEILEYELHITSLPGVTYDILSTHYNPAEKVMLGTATTVTKDLNSNKFAAEESKQSKNQGIHGSTTQW